METYVSVCQSGFSHLLSEELETLRKAVVIDRDDSTVIYKASGVQHCAFAHYSVSQFREIKADSVNALSGSIFDYFINANAGVPITSGWPLVVTESRSETGLSRRASSVTDSFSAILKKRMSRVAKLMKTSYDIKRGEHRGLFIYFKDFNTVLVSTGFYYGGQKRMADDSQAPSRSYLKAEEAYGILTHEPAEGDIVCDLGAAPGGWSYSAAKRGAAVYAIDNGPLKGGAKDNPLIFHRKSDAFKYIPEVKTDWLFCDMVEEPHRILKLIKEWFTAKRCSFFVVNLKFGHVNPVKLIEEIENDSELTTLEYTLLHLYHDRDEFTITGKLL